MLPASIRSILLTCRFILRLQVELNLPAGVDPDTKGAVFCRDKQTVESQYGRFVREMFVKACKKGWSTFLVDFNVYKAAAMIATATAAPMYWSSLERFFSASIFFGRVV